MAGRMYILIDGWIDAPPFIHPFLVFPSIESKLHASSSPKRTILEDGHSLERSSSASSTHEKKSHNRTPSFNAVTNVASTISSPITLLTLLIVTSVVYPMLYAPSCTPTPLRMRATACDHRRRCHSDSCCGDHCREIEECELRVRSE